MLTLSDGPPGASRNPPWTRDELILALDLYVRTNAGTSPGLEAEARPLSALLNSLQRALGYSGETLRNPNGVKMKLMNFRAHDPAFAGRTGLSRGNKLEAEVWRDFADRPATLATAAAVIRVRLTGSAGRDLLGADTGELDGIAEASEGRALTVLHLRRERSTALARAKKDRALKTAGRLACEACGCDYAERYGDRGHGFIECHHTRPVAELGDGAKTRLEDLALVCASCHRMIHARRPWLEIEELREVVKSNPAHGI